MNHTRHDADGKAPHDDDAERALLSAAMRGRDVYLGIRDIVDTTDFYFDHHQKILRAIEAAYRGGTQPDLVIVASELLRAGHLADIGGRNYLAEIDALDPTGANAVHHARIVREHANRRRTLHAAREFLRDASDPRRPARESLDNMGNALAELVRQAERGADGRFKIYSDPAFSGGDFRPNWFIENVLVRGEPYGIGAAMKTLKTSIGCDMAISLATGTPFLGTFPVVRPVGTLFLSGESGHGTTQLLRSRILKAKGLDGQDLPRMCWQFDVPQLDDLTGMARLVEEYAKRKVEVAILDPLYLMFGDVDPKNIFDSGRALRNVSRLFIERGITPLLIHHANRTLKTGEKMELHHLSHAGFAEFVRQYMLINRTRAYDYDGRHVLNVRFGGSVGLTSEHIVEVAEGVLNEDFTGRKWAVTVTPVVDSRQGAAAGREDRNDNKAEGTKLKNAKLKEKLLADIDTEMAKDFPAVSMNKLRTDYGWQCPDLKRISECLLLDRLIELHPFTYKAGQGATQKTTGFRRTVARTQADIPFTEQSVGTEQPVFSPDPRPVQPAVPGEGGEQQPEQPVGNTPLKGVSHGEPAVAHQPVRNVKPKNRPRTSKKVKL